MKLNNQNKQVSHDGNEPQELHVCMGLNSCENKGVTNHNTCAGAGECATVHHACHVLNECKGQGGCGLFGTNDEVCHPGINDCKSQGSCGSPILSSRFIAQGPNKGKSVWILARKRFEQRMQNEGKTFKAAPIPEINIPENISDEETAILEKEIEALKILVQEKNLSFGPTDDYLNNINNTTGQDYSSCGQSGNRFCSFGNNDQHSTAFNAMYKWIKFVTNSLENADNMINTCDGK